MCAAACRVTHAFQGFNQISDLGASSLADALKINTCLTQLDLVSAGFGGGGGCGCWDVHVAKCGCVVGLQSECVFDLRGGVACGCCVVGMG